MIYQKTYSTEPCAEIMDVKRRNSTVGPRAQVKCLTRDMMPDYLSMFSGLVTEDWAVGTLTLRHRPKERNKNPD